MPSLLRSLLRQVLPQIQIQGVAGCALWSGHFPATHPRGEDPQKDKGPKAIRQGLRQAWDRIQLFPGQKSLWVPEDLAQNNLDTLGVVPATLGRLRWELESRIRGQRNSGILTQGTNNRHYLLQMSVFLSELADFGELPNLATQVATKHGCPCLNIHFKE